LFFWSFETAVVVVVVGCFSVGKAAVARVGDIMML